MYEARRGQITSEDVVTITKVEYNALQDRDLELTALETAGVDNWVLYTDAMVLADKWRHGDTEATL